MQNFFIFGDMQYLKKALSVLCFIVASQPLLAQHDSVRIRERIKRIEEELKTDSLLRKKYDDMTFYYSQMFPQKFDKGETEKFQLSGYIDTYYAGYTDSVGPGNYQKFPTAAPKSNAFGLNIAQLSAKYQSEKLRGIFTLHYGDIPDAAWSSKYNFIQEAHVGVRLVPKVWLDAGFFRTHLGFESIQPRENITTSIATTTYYEPYYLSGVKLSYQPTDKLTLQANAFNGFNTFVETNRNKCIGFTVVYEFSTNFIITYNNLYTDESAIGERAKERFYNNFYLAYKSSRWDFGAECNYGVQQHSKLNNSNATASVISGLIAAKYKMAKGKYACYVRGEVFDDPDEILTGPVQNQYHELVGINLWGATAGFEIKPIPNSYIRFEGRTLITEKSEAIFYSNRQFSNYRYEAIASFGVWF